MATARVRFSLSAGEFEVEGDQDFVERYEGLFADVLKKMSEVPVSPVSTSVPSNPGAAQVQTAGGGMESEGEVPAFGEALHRLPKGTSGTEQILIAGYYASRKSADKTFATGDANRLLIEQGIKLANPSQSLKNNMESKRVFKSGANYRISRDGLDRVAQLLGLDGGAL